MNVKNPIITSESSAPLGTYSQAIRSGDMVFISAQSPIIPATGEMIKGTVEDHIRQSFENVKAVAIAAGGECDKIVKVTIFLTSLANFSIANKVMGAFLLNHIQQERQSKFQPCQKGRMLKLMPSCI